MNPIEMPSNSADLRNLEKEVSKNGKEKQEFKAAVGLSRKWDAYEAGKEVAEDAMNKLGRKPDFAILMCSYHYNYHGGYENLLKGIWSVLPEGTELIGGVVSGFMIQEGCYIRGASIALVSNKDMDITVSVGNSTKRNPKKAARECAKGIKDKLGKSKYKNGLLIEFTSCAFLPKLPIIGSKKVLDSEFIAKTVALSQSSMSLMQYGMGREEDVREELGKQLPDYRMIGNSTWDASRYKDHRQFVNHKVYKNSIVALGIKTDLDMYLNTGYGFHKTNKRFKVTKLDGFGNIISKINGKPARGEYVRIQGWDPKDINEQLIRRTFFVLPAFEKEGTIYPEVIGMVYGSHIIVGRRVENPDMFMLTASGKSLIGAVDEALDNFREVPKFAFISSCHARLEALGSKVYIEQEKIKQHLGDTPFLLGWGGGESIYSKETGCRHRHESFNAGIIY